MLRNRQSSVVPAGRLGRGPIECRLHAAVGKMRRIPGVRPGRRRDRWQEAPLPDRGLGIAHTEEVEHLALPLADDLAETRIEGHGGLGARWRGHWSFPGCFVDRLTAGDRQPESAQDE